jgi:hypothetical protein
VVDLPASLQGPGLDLDEQSVATAFEVFDVALRWLQQALPDIRITIVHLPSVLSTYRLVGPGVTVEVPDHSATVHSAINFAARSDEICRRLRDIALDVGAGFLMLDLQCGNLEPGKSSTVPETGLISTA